MGTFKKKLRSFAHLAWVIRIWHLLQIAAPIAVAGYTAFLAATESLSTAQLVTLTVLTLAGALLTVNQLRMLIGFPIAVTTIEDYAYGLNYGGVFAGYAPHDPNATLQIGVHLSNSARGPIKYQVERMDVIVGTTALPIKNYTNRGGIIPMMSARVFRDSPYPMSAVKHLIGGKHLGSLEMVVLYGPADGDPVRRFHFKIELTVDVQPAAVVLADSVVLEKDESVY